jgi:hypothetical protein
MKQFFIIILTGLALISCSDNTQQEKNLLNELLKVHDKVMSNDELLMKNKMKLDTLIKLNVKDTIEKQQVKVLDTKLSVAEEAMENWMHKFEPDVNGKSHDEVMKYYGDQKKQIMTIDSQMNAAITESNKYLSNNKSK